jgi:hypothetical protein
MALAIWLVTYGAITLIVGMRILLGKKVKTSWRTPEVK